MHSWSVFNSNVNVLVIPKSVSAKKLTYDQLRSRISELEKELANHRTVRSLAIPFAMLDITPNAITVHDFKGRFLYTNKKNLELHGYTEQEFMSLTLRDIDVPESANKIDERMALIMNNDEAIFEVEHYRKDRSILPLEVFVTKITWQDTPAIMSIANDISLRKKAEAENKLLKQAIEQTIEGLAITDLEGNVRFANAAWGQMHGYTESEMKDQHHSMFYTPEQFVHEVKPFLEKIHETGANRCEVGHVKKDGTTFPAQMGTSLIRNEKGDPVGYICVAIDLTETKRATAAIEAGEIRFRNIVQSSPMGMHMYELRGEELIFIGANPAADRILGIDHTIFIGKSIEEAFPGLINTEVPKHYHEAAKDGIIWQSEQIEYNEGNLSGAFDVVAFQIGPRKMVAVFNDITERKRAEEELKKAKEKAEESDKLKTAFLQNMSHEIRTPMNAVTGFAYLLDNPNLTDEKRKKFTQVIIHSSNQLLSIVNDILTISSIDTHQEKLNCQQVCVNRLINDLSIIFKQRIGDRNISLIAETPLSDQHSEIMTDNTKLMQVLTNLLTNAIKFTRQGSVRFGYVRKENMLEFFVKDSGIGIKPEAHDSIFQRFRQANAEINKVYGGTGLGLSISKAFVELMGGKIWLESELGKGSAFFFTIPYIPAEKEMKSDYRKPLPERPGTILIAEDEELNFLYLEELLQEIDVKIVHTKDGKETVDACRSDQSIGLVLMDIKMPVMDGIEATREIRKIRPDLPVIAQSAYIIDSEIEAYRQAGINDYIKKPIVKKELYGKLLKYI